jgi:hypothetical protein
MRIEAAFVSILLIATSVLALRHDAKAPDGRLVQIKATQAKSVGLRSEPDRLIVLKLNHDGSTNEVYNGPGAPAWHQAGKMQKNGQRSIDLSRLRNIMEEVPPCERVHRH